MYFICPVLKLFDLGDDSQLIAKFNEPNETMSTKQNPIYKEILNSNLEIINKNLIELEKIRILFLKGALENPAGGKFQF